MYEAVLEAQEAGVAAVRAGVETSAVDEAARAVLRRAGYEKEFVHSTGARCGHRRSTRLRGWARSLKERRACSRPQP